MRILIRSLEEQGYEVTATDETIVIVPQSTGDLANEVMDFVGQYPIQPDIAEVVIKSITKQITDAGITTAVIRASTIRD